ncbi:flippase [Treponema parvum]|uniref:flippase n=1 Tax=Treponema parvum TaxID=138851 RepID=UPI001AEC2430|nr:flippase [Treponema parvum]QTQ16255.1 flippase [Treponema parvum]
MPQKSLKNNAFFNFIRSFLNIAFPIISFPYASRILMPEGIGKVNFANSVIDYFVLIASLGIAQYATREAAILREDFNNLGKFLKEILLITLFATIFAYILLIISLFAVPKFHEYRMLMIVCSTKILFVSAGINWLFIAQEEYSYITLRTAIFQIISLVSLFLFVHKSDDYITYAFIGIFSNAGSNICNIFYSRKFINILIKTKLQLKKHIKPVFYFFGISCSQQILNGIDSVMLGFIMNDTAVGLYAAAIKIKSLVTPLIATITGTLLPRASFYVNNNNSEKYDELIQKGLGISLFLSFPCTVGIICICKPFILLFCGENYLQAVTPMIIISPMIIASAFNSFLNDAVINPLKMEKKSFYIQFSGVAMNVLLNYILIKKLNVLGAALSTVIIEYILTVARLYICFPTIKKTFKLRSILDPLICSFFMGIIISFFAKEIQNNFIYLSVAIILGFFSYTTFMIIIRNPIMKLFITFFQTSVTKIIP